VVVKAAVKAAPVAGPAPLPRRTGVCVRRAREAGWERAAAAAGTWLDGALDSGSGGGKRALVWVPAAAVGVGEDDGAMERTGLFVEPAADA
jgi:hypothetical protein